MRDTTLDLLSFGPSEKEDLRLVFQDIAATPVTDDGLVFDPESVRAEDIREDATYGGVRVRIMAKLGTAELPIQIDIGLGDAVTPAPEQVTFPVLLDFPAPLVRTYPVYTVVAEKFEAMVKLGIANTRMKDFHDVWFLMRRFELDETILREAVRATFSRRKTELPPWPEPLTDAFAEDSNKQVQWGGFVRRNGLSGLPERFSEIVASIRTQLALMWRA